MNKDQNNEIYTRTCVDCGRVMEQVGPTCKRCPACAAKHSNLLQNRQRAAYAQRETCRRREAQTAESRRQLHADALAARQAGMSYGKYMLTKNKKPAGAGAPTSSKG